MTEGQQTPYTVPLPVIYRHVLQDIQRMLNPVSARSVGWGVRIF